MKTELIQAIRDLAAKYPNGLYQRPSNNPATQCSYIKGIVKDGPETCGCIVGQALRIVDPNIQPLLFRYPTKSSTDLFQENYPGFDEILADLKAIDWIGDVQKNQDNELTWSECVRLADAAFPLGW